MKRHTHYIVIVTAILFLIMQINFQVFASIEDGRREFIVDDVMQERIFATSPQKNEDKWSLVLDEKGFGKDKDKGRGVKGEDVKHGRLIPPGHMKEENRGPFIDIEEKGKNKGKGKGKGKGKDENKGRGKGSKNKQTSIEWSGEWLTEVQPITADENLLIRFDVPYDEVKMFEDAYPSILPLTETYITSDYGKRKKPRGRGSDFHNGVDLKAYYQDIWATGSGTVIYAGYKAAYGYMVVIDHGYGIETKYAHNSRLLVSKGQSVERFDVIAISGNSGNSTGPHLHYEIEFDGVNQDPMEIIYSRMEN